MHPYATDSTERRSVILWLALISILIAYGLHLLLSKASTKWLWLIDIPSVMGVFGILYTIFDKQLWRWQFLRKLTIVRVPNLNGFWVAEGKSTTHSTDFAATVKIRQTWTHISITMETEHSRSHSITASLLIDQPDEVTLSYEYRNEPKPNAISTMHAHRGTAVLRLKGEELLEGEYYSGRDRQNYGTLRLNRKTG